MAVQLARLVIVNDDLDHGAVLAYDRAKFDVAVVLLPLLSPYQGGRCYRRMLRPSRTAWTTAASTSA